MPEMDLSLTQRGLVTNAHYLRETHMRLRALKHGTATQLIINLLGDSFVTGDFWTPVFAKALHTVFGLAGVGWVGFGFYGTGSAPPYTTGGTQPNFGGTPTVDGNARPDLVPKPTFDGSWTSTYNSPGSNLPSISYARSSTAGDRARFDFPAGHTSSTVFYYKQTTAGSFRYSWDGGSTWAGTITYDNSSNNSASDALVGTIAGAGTLLFEVVSGQVNLGGVEMKSTASGVRINKLGVSGGATNNFATAAGAANWRTRFAVLGAHLNIAGWQTNDQGGAFAPDGAYTTNLTTIATNLRVIAPYSDLLLTAPPENQRPANAYPMSGYTAATRALARTQKAAFLDHQPNFGELPADYAWANASRQWYASDLIHPVTATGGAAMANAMLEAVMPR